MFGITDPEQIMPEERANEVTGILAQGFLRFRQDGLFEADSEAKLEGKNPVTRNISNGCLRDKSAS